MHNKTILIDLDGVLNEYTGGFDPNYIPPMKKDADRFLKKLCSKYEIKLFTARDKVLTQTWVFENCLDRYITEITNEKVPAWLIIDDRCIKFCGDYDDLVKEIENFKPWYKK